MPTMTPLEVLENLPLLIYASVVMGLCFRLLRTAFNYVYRNF